MTSLLSDKRFWLASTERAVLTMAQTFAAELAVFSAVEIREEGLDGLPWYPMISVAVVAGLLSFLASMGKGSSGSAGYQVTLREEETPRVEEPRVDPMIEEVPPGLTPLHEEVPVTEEEPPQESEKKAKPSVKPRKGGTKKNK